MSLSFEESLLNTPLRKIMSDKKLFHEDLPFDEYHLVMAQNDLLENKYDNKATKTYFYRIAPFSGSYIIFAGLNSLLYKLDTFSYKDIVDYLKMKNYDKAFIEYAESRDKLKIDVFSLPDNSVAFPEEPIAIFKTNLIDSRIIEGIVLTELNFASLSATKWHRIKIAAMNASIMEFGRRRAQNALKASLYSYVAGVNSTSNCEANFIFGIPSSGTMGHEYIQSFGSEYEAFDAWLTHNIEKPCLLVDTINTIQSGIINASKAFLKHKDRLIKAGTWDRIGFRVDSGDLAYLAVYCYHKLKKELNADKISIVLSNDLDEYRIESIFTQLAVAGETNVMRHISFGVGTRGASAWGEPALGGVCKMSEYDDKYVIKVSNTNEKTTMPGDLRSALITDSEGQYVTDLIYLSDEDLLKIDKFVHPNDDSKFILNDKSFSQIKPRQHHIYSSDGIRSDIIGDYSNQSLKEICGNSSKVLSCLDWSYKRLINSHKARVSLSPKLYEIRWKMIRANITKMKK